MQNQDPIISRFLKYFLIGQKLSKKERGGETRAVVDMLPQCERMELHVYVKVDLTAESMILNKANYNNWCYRSVLTQLHKQS